MFGYMYTICVLHTALVAFLRTCVLHTLWFCLLYKLYKVLFMMMAPNSDHLEIIPTTYIFFYNHSDQPCK